MFSLLIFSLLFIYYEYEILQLRVVKLYRFKLADDEMLVEMESPPWVYCI